MQPTLVKLKNIAFDLFIPFYTPIISQQAILSEQKLSKSPTETQYVTRFVFMKEVNTHNF